jgi:hypothetical protein
VEGSQKDRASRFLVTLVGVAVGVAILSYVVIVVFGVGYHPSHPTP